MTQHNEESFDDNYDSYEDYGDYKHKNIVDDSTFVSSNYMSEKVKEDLGGYEIDQYSSLLAEHNQKVKNLSITILVNLNLNLF